MTTRVRMSLVVALEIALCLGATVTTTHAQTSGSISAETSNTSQPMQANWIGCIIFFHGEAHACSLTGLQVPVTGAARVSGMVNNVKNIADAAGTYKVVGVDDTFGGGHLKLKNDNGVTMTLWPFAASIEGSIDPNTILQVGSSGMKIELEK